MCHISAGTFCSVHKVEYIILCEVLKGILFVQGCIRTLCVQVCIYVCVSARFVGTMVRFFRQNPSRDCQRPALGESIDETTPTIAVSEDPSEVRIPPPALDDITEQLYQPTNVRVMTSPAGKRQSWWLTLGQNSVAVMAKSIRHQSSGWIEMADKRKQRVEMRPSVNAPPLSEQDTQLFRAIDSQCCDQVSLWLDRGANINAQNGFFGETPLHQAARLRWRAGLELLLNRGALVTVGNHYFQTPLHFAAVSNSADCIAALLAKDCRAVLAQDMRGYTPLHDAVTGQDVRCVRQLVEAGSDVTATDNQGDTPLHKCANSSAFANMVTLLNEGADLKAKNHEGETALALLLRNIPNALKGILDHSLVPNKLPQNNKNFELTINFKPLIRNKALGHTDIVRNFIKIGEEDVLKHPVCQTFLELKWRHVVKIFLFKIFFYFTFVIVATTITLEKFVSEKKIANNTTYIENLSKLDYKLLKMGDYFYLTAIAMIVILVLIEIINLLSSLVTYFTNMMTYINWLLFITFFVITGGKGESVLPWQSHVAAFFTLILWSKAMHMIGQFPGCGIYVSMFTTVARVICKMFLVYLSLIIAFALSFHISFAASGSFKDPGNSFMKTLTLMIGEVDYEGLFFSKDFTPLFGTSHVIFFLFLLLISVILSNLLVALAVSDVQGLRQGAHLQRLKKQSQLIHETELIRSFFKSIFKCSRLQNIIERIANSFHLDLSTARVFILPNHPQKSRYLQIHHSRTKSLTELKISKELVDLFWQALRGQESGESNSNSAATRSRSTSSTMPSGGCRATFRQPNDSDHKLRVLSDEMGGKRSIISSEDIKAIVNEAEKRIGILIDRKLEQFRKELIPREPNRSAG